MRKTMEGVPDDTQINGDASFPDLPVKLPCANEVPQLNEGALAGSNGREARR